jgi:hypothetical protein
MEKTLAGAAVIRIPFIEAIGHRAKMTHPDAAPRPRQRRHWALNARERPDDRLPCVKESGT